MAIFDISTYRYNILLKLKNFLNFICAYTFEKKHKNIKTCSDYTGLTFNYHLL